MMKETLTAKLTEALVRYPVSAAAACVIEQGHSTMATLGVTRLDQPEPVDEYTVFDLASLTKVLVTTPLILKLMLNGRLYPETPVRTIVADFPDDHITIHQLLTHTSGLPADDKAYKQLTTNQFRPWLATVKPVYQPGTRVVYSDLGYIWLGYVIETLLGPLNQVAERCLFKPLGLTKIGYLPTQWTHPSACAATEFTTLRGCIQGQVHDGKAYLMGQVSGHAGLFASLHDLAIYVDAMLRDDVVFSDQYRARLVPVYTEPLPIRRTYGWFRNDPSIPFASDCHADCLYHTGFTGTSIYLEPQTKKAVILLTNRVHPDRSFPYIQELRKYFYHAVLSDHCADVDAED